MLFVFATKSWSGLDLPALWSRSCLGLGCDDNTGFRWHSFANSVFVQSSCAAESCKRVNKVAPHVVLAACSTTERILISGEILKTISFPFKHFFFSSQKTFHSPVLEHFNWPLCSLWYKLDWGVRAQLCGCSCFAWEPPGACGGLWGGFAVRWLSVAPSSVRFPNSFRLRQVGRKRSGSHCLPTHAGVPESSTCVCNASGSHLSKLETKACGQCTLSRLIHNKYSWTYPGQSLFVGAFVLKWKKYLDDDQ